MVRLSIARRGRSILAPFIQEPRWNAERRHDTGMGAGPLVGWFAELAKLANAARREFHLLTPLSGSRPTALNSVRIGDIDFRRRLLHMPKPKGR